MKTQGVILQCSEHVPSTWSALGRCYYVLLLSILGVATMWQAVFADVGTTLITILNTIRILK